MLYAEELVVALVGDQNPGSEAISRRKAERERREQRRCQGRSNGVE